MRLNATLFVKFLKFIIPNFKHEFQWFEIWISDFQKDFSKSIFYKFWTPFKVLRFLRTRRRKHGETARLDLIAGLLSSSLGIDFSLFLKILAPGQSGSLIRTFCLKLSSSRVSKKCVRVGQTWPTWQVFDHFSIQVHFCEIEKLKNWI